MNDMLRMTILERLSQIRNKPSRSPLTKASLGTKLLIQLSTGRILENKINILIVIKISVHAQNVLVSQMTLNFNFAA